MRELFEFERIDQKQLKLVDINELRKLFYQGVEDLEICPLSIGKHKLLTSKELIYLLPRHIFTLALSNHDIKSVDIAKIINKDHATVLHSNEQMKYLLKNNRVARKFYGVFDILISEYLDSLNVITKVITKRKKQKQRKHAI